MQEVKLEKLFTEPGHPTTYGVLAYFPNGVNTHLGSVKFAKMITWNSWQVLLEFYKYSPFNANAEFVQVALDVTEVTDGKFFLLMPSFSNFHKPTLFQDYTNNIHKVFSPYSQDSSIRTKWSNGTLTEHIDSLLTGENGEYLLDLLSRSWIPYDGDFGSAVSWLARKETNWGFNNDGLLTEQELKVIDDYRKPNVIEDVNNRRIVGKAIQSLQEGTSRTFFQQPRYPTFTDEWLAQRLKEAKESSTDGYPKDFSNQWTADSAPTLLPSDYKGSVLISGLYERPVLLGLIARQALNPDVCKTASFVELHPDRDVEEIKRLIRSWRLVPTYPKVYLMGAEQNKTRFDQFAQEVDTVIWVTRAMPYQTNPFFSVTVAKRRGETDKRFEALHLDLRESPEYRKLMSLVDS